MDAAGQFSYSKTVTATTKATSFAVEAYPNPVSDKLTVRRYGNQGGNGTIQLTDVSGKVVKQLDAQKTETIIDMSGLAQGAYFLKYSDDKHKQTIKVNKQ
jgi:hypothetical protein